MRRERLAAGRVRGAHGTQGWLRVECFSRETRHLASLEEVTLGRETTPRRVQEVRVVSGGLLVRLEGVCDRAGAAALVGREVWVARSSAEPALDGEYYVGDLEGCAVRQGGVTLGEVVGFVEGGATELLEVRGTDGVSFLVPFLDLYVGEISVDRGVIELREGFDLEGVRGGGAR